MKLIIKLVTRTTCTCSKRASALYHEIRDNTVKFKSVIIWFALWLYFVLKITFCKTNKVSNCTRS